MRAVSGTADLHITQDVIRVSGLIAEACSKLDRNLTRKEWTTYLGGLPYRESCQQLNPAVTGKQNSGCAAFNNLLGIPARTD